MRYIDLTAASLSLFVVRFSNGFRYARGLTQVRSVTDCILDLDMHMSFCFSLIPVQQPIVHCTAYFQNSRLVPLCIYICISIL